MKIDFPGIDIVAYADDILIGLANGISKNTVIEYASAKFKEIGLNIKYEKCKCTIDEDVDFMGVKYN